MNKILSILVKELDPRQDLKDFDDIVNHDTHNPESLQKAIAQTPYFGMNTIKHFVRGAIVGSLAGLTYSAITGNDPNECLQMGAKTGAALDSVQYWVRGYFL